MVGVKELKQWPNNWGLVSVVGHFLHQSWRTAYLPTLHLCP